MQTSKQSCELQHQRFVISVDADKAGIGKVKRHILHAMCFLSVFQCDTVQFQHDIHPFP